MGSLVLQSWMSDLSWKKQTVLLCALRGPDAGGSAEVKAWVRWIRRHVLENAAPSKTFMGNDKIKSIQEIADGSPLVLDMLPVHYLSHLMHAFQVMVEHPSLEVRCVSIEQYNALCEYLHVAPEPLNAYHKRLADESSLVDFCRKASDKVATWPKWKRDALGCTKKDAITKRYVINKHPNDPGPDEFIGEFDTMKEVEDYYESTLILNDPEGVGRGDYTIDDMMEEG